MAINKVIYGGKTLIDLTADSVTPEVLLAGATAHDKSGEIITGTCIFDDYISPDQHRMIFRGKNLGSSFTSSQKTQVQNGTFKDIYLGDYWKIGSYTYRIVDIDYWYGNEATELKHHLVIMPDENLYNAQMNTTDTTSTGYYGSDMRENGLAKAKSIINSAFGISIISHFDFFVNSASNGIPNGCVSEKVTVELPSERMMYGSEIRAAKGSYVSSRTCSKSQLALFAVVPRFIGCRTIGGRSPYWLRDVVSSTSFSGMAVMGFADINVASSNLGVRPVFAIG